MDRKKTAKIMIIGGHLTPALAVLDELQAQDYTNIVWVGNKYSQTAGNNPGAEYLVITKRNIPFINFSAGKIWRRWTLATVTKGLYNLLMIPIGFIKAIYLVFRERPVLIMSFGGYLALPLIVAGKILGKKLITHEQTVVVGLANKMIAKFADKILISWQDSAGFFPENKTILTGNPLRKEIFQVASQNINFTDDLPVIYVTGGNQGANTINWRLLKILPDVLRQANIIHQTGKSTLTRDYEKAIAARNSLPEKLQGRYLVYDNIFAAEIGEILQKADLIISRSGANIISEILALGKLAILIPLPWSSGQEQLLNARLVAETGLGLILEQYDNMPPAMLYDFIKKGLSAQEKNQDFFQRPLSEARRTAKKMINPDAAQLITGEISALLKT